MRGFVLFVMAFSLISLIGCSSSSNEEAPPTASSSSSAPTASSATPSSTPSPSSEIIQMGDKPPEASIKIRQETYPAKLGTYCWTSACVDTVGPEQLLKDEKPLPVSPETDIQFVMDYDPQPNQVHVVMFQDGQSAEVAVENNTIKAPAEKGTYYYSYAVWWMDEKNEHVSHGDASYNFVIKVI